MALDTIPKQEGGKLKAVASGTLPSGQPVVVNSDGTVSVVAGENVPQSAGTAVVFESGTTEFVSATFDSSANKVVIAYKDDGNSNYGTAVVGTVSGTAISFGSPVIFHSDQTRDIETVFDSNANKVVVAYRDDNNDGDPAAVVGTVSGTSISFGTPVFISNDQCVSESIGCAFDSDTNKVVFVYANSYNSSYGTAVVGTVSGTTISFGTAVVYNSGSTTHNYVAYDTNAQKVVVVYRDSSNSGYGTAVVGTVSGTSISFGSEVVFHATSTTDIEAVYDSTAQKVVAVYGDGGNSNYGTAVVGTVSGTSISFGSPVVFESSAVGYIAATYDQSAQKVVVAYRGPLLYGTSISGAVSGTSITFDSAFTFEAARTEQIGATYDSNAEKVVFGYEDRGNGNKGTGIVVQNAYTSTTLTSENYIGMSGGVIKTFSQSEAIGTESTYETGEGSSVVGYDAAAKKSLLVFADSLDSYLLKARLVTTTGTTLSYGSVVSIPGGQVGSAQAIVYDTVNEKLVVFIRGNSNYPYAVVATISGDSLTFGTPVVVTSVSSFPIDAAYDSTSGKIVVVYNDELKVGTVSGTSISFGSEATLNQGLNDVGLAHDPSSNKTIIVGYTSVNNGKVWLGTVSGTSISIGSPTDLPINPARIYGVFYDPPSGKIGMIIQSGPGPGEGLVATISGDTVSFGTEVEFQSGINDGSAGYDSKVNKFIVACRSINSPYPGLLRVGTISGDTFSFASPVTFNTGETAPHNNVGFDSDQGTSIIGFSDGGDSNYQKAIGFQAAGSYEVISEVADGDNATVDIVGTVSTNQSGLTAGQKYYVQTDGTIGTTPANPSVLAGTAVSATKMVVKS